MITLSPQANSHFSRRTEARRNSVSLNRIHTPGKILFFLLLLSGISCSNGKKTTNKEISATGPQYPIVIDAEKEYPQKEVFIQDFATVRYIPLETTNNSLVKMLHSHQPIILPEGIFIETNDYIYRFSPAGKFENRVGQPGKGPNEYLYIHQFCVDREKPEVYIFNGDTTIFVYGFNGAFTRKFQVQGRYCGGIKKLNQNALLMAKNTLSSEMEKSKHSPYHIVSSQNGSLVRTVLAPNNSPIMFSTNEDQQPLCYISNSIAMYQDELILKSLATDTITAFDARTGQTYQKFIKTPSNDGKETIEQAWLDYSFETPRHASLFLVNFNRATQRYDYRGIWVDKKTGRIQRSFIRNRDIGDKRKSTLAPTTLTTHETDNAVVYFYDAMKIKDWYEQGLLSGELARIAEKIDENDNPVMMIAEFTEEASGDRQTAQQANSGSPRQPPVSGNETASE